MVLELYHSAEEINFVFTYEVPCKYILKPESRYGIAIAYMCVYFF
jgi:hypothetical protein